MTAETRLAHKQEVADLIESCLQKGAADYAEIGGLNRLISTVAEATGWSRADVYTALRVVENVEFNFARQTIEVKRPK